MKKHFLPVLALMLALVFCTAGAEGSLLQAVYDSLDVDAGIHMNYTMRSASMGIETIYEVQAKGTSSYTAKTSQAFGQNVVSVSCFIGDTSYILNPDKMEAQVVMTLAPSLLKYYSFLRQDELGKVMDKWAHSSDFQVETREVDGVSYTVEVFPAGESGAENAFYFDENGRLVYLRNDAIELLGELFYTVNVIDTEVDESLFDISAYTVISK